MTNTVVKLKIKEYPCQYLFQSQNKKMHSSELRPGFQGKIRILHIYASLMLFPQAIGTKLRVQVDDGPI